MSRAERSMRLGRAVERLDDAPLAVALAPLVVELPGEIDRSAAAPPAPPAIADRLAAGQGPGRSPRRGAVLSALVHIAVIALILWLWPLLWEEPPLVAIPASVTFVALGAGIGEAPAREGEHAAQPDAAADVTKPSEAAAAPPNPEPPPALPTDTADVPPPPAPDTAQKTAAPEAPAAPAPTDAPVPEVPAPPAQRQQTADSSAAAPQDQPPPPQAERVSPEPPQEAAQKASSEVPSDATVPAAQEAAAASPEPPVAAPAQTASLPPAPEAQQPAQQQPTQQPALARPVEVPPTPSPPSPTPPVPVPPLPSEAAKRPAPARSRPPPKSADEDKEARAPSAQKPPSHLVKPQPSKPQPADSQPAAPEPPAPQIALAPQPIPEVPHLPPASKFIAPPSSAPEPHLPPSSMVMAEATPGTGGPRLPPGSTFKPGGPGDVDRPQRGHAGEAGGTGGALQSGGARGNSSRHGGGTLIDQISDLQARIDRLLLVYAPDHPDVVALQRQVDQLFAQLGPLTEEELAPTRQQLGTCLARESAGLGVTGKALDLSLVLERDGAVREARIGDPPGNDPGLSRRLLEAMRRCGPFPLPPQRFLVWQRLTLRIGAR